MSALGGVASGQTLPSVKWADVRSFTYQLQDADLDAIGRTKFELVVIDYSADGSEAKRFTAAQIAALQHSAGGAKRVLAYLSIGEAEDYRFYWDKSWRPASGTPGWLDTENPEWKGNYKVRYWDPDWQKIVMQYLDLVIDAGFDGVYLDCVDSFEYWDGESKVHRKTAPREMADFVLAIAKHARVDRKKPEFAVFPQNGEALAKFGDYLDAVNGIGREDVFFDGNKRVKGRDVDEATRYLDVFKKAGKLVMTIDYPTKAALIEEDYKRSGEKGYVPYVTVRGLDRLVINKGHEPTGGS